jgi:diaminohydroxyphosphoribosylaminopyrimidine deaminase/5-amino-6-(5-phosphoribosylamino)uracil reductase
MDAVRLDASTPPLKISNAATSRWVHQLRTEVDAILIGANTAQLDNPLLNARKWHGPSPVPVIIDPNLRLDSNLRIFNTAKKVLVLNAHKTRVEGNIHFEKFESGHLENHINKILMRHNLHRVLVEGGAKTLTFFITHNLWDIAHSIQGNTHINHGINAPLIPLPHRTHINQLNNNIITTYENM